MVLRYISGTFYSTALGKKYNKCRIRKSLEIILIIVGPPLEGIIEYQILKLKILQNLPNERALKIKI